MTRTSNAFLPRAFTTLLLAVILCAAVILGVHALEQHGSDAQAVRRCMDERGPFAIWAEKDGCTIHNLVNLEGERKVGDQIRIVAQDGKEYEKTSFIPRNGVLEKIERWLSGKGAVRIFPK